MSNIQNNHTAKIGIANIVGEYFTAYALGKGMPLFFAIAYKAVELAIDTINTF